MILKTATIANHNGIHVRPSKVIAAAASDYPGTITITKNDYSIDQINIMNLLTMALIKGDIITIEVSGLEEEIMAETLKNLFETQFDFPAKK